MKCQDYPNIVFKGTLHYEGHSVTFNVFDDYVEVTNIKNAMISVSKMDIDRAIKEQKDLISWGYTWTG